MIVVRQSYTFFRSNPHTAKTLIMRSAKIPPKLRSQAFFAYFCSGNTDSAQKR
jgi:hypothetical protein